MKDRTAEDAVADIAKNGLPPTVRGVEERILLGIELEQLPRRGPVEHTGIAGIVGPAVFTSYTQYKRARFVVLAARSASRAPQIVETARKALADMEDNTITVSAAYDRVRAAEKTFWAAGFDLEGVPLTPPPAPNARHPKARALRAEWLRALAAKGATSTEIAARLGIGEPAVRKMARDTNVVIPADQAMSRSQKRAHDPDRAMAAAVNDLAALAWSLERIDPTCLDPDQAADWSAQLQEHTRAIGRVARRMNHPKKENL